MNEIEKIDLNSLSITSKKLEELKAIFPQAFTDGKFSLEALKTELGDIAEDQKERFGLSWAGKANCIKIIQQPSTGTLLPEISGSVDFDSTQNVIIEGDNLESLKLLQKSYYGKVKLIYIDPPYNTGKEFIYPDNFQEGLQEYLKRTNQIDGSGFKLTTNTDKGGRFHTNWLNMMYPRLYLARNLLKDDGVIFVSIDDAEIHNLAKLLDEIFGEENFIGCLIIQTATDNNPRQINTEHEYMLAYAKNINSQDYWERPTDRGKLIQEAYERIKVKHANDVEAIQKELREWIKENKSKLDEVSHYDNVDLKGVFHDGDIANTKDGGYKYEVIHPITKRPCKIPDKGFRFPETTMKSMIEADEILFGEDETTLIKPKKRLENARELLRSVIYEDGRAATKRLATLLEKDVFNNPKSEHLLERLIDFVTEKDDLVLDFFAGSGSTGHAIFNLNQRDSGKRKFILIQLPEALDIESKSQKNGALFCDKISKPRNVAEITKERIRRAGRNLAKDNQLLSIDFGFKAFKLSSSNFSTWDSSNTDVSKLSESLKLFTQNINPDRYSEDILYEVLLKSGFELTVDIKKLTIAKKEFFSIEDGALLICLERELSIELIEGMLELNPFQIICLDEGFKGNDQLKVNVIQTIKSRQENEDTKTVFRVV